MPFPKDKRNTKGFDKHPENINRKGRPPKLIRHINNELEAEGFEPAKIDHITQAYLTLINLPLSRIKEISLKENDEYPLLYKLVAKNLLGNRGSDMLEKLLDRGIGKPSQKLDVDTTVRKITGITFDDTD